MEKEEDKTFLWWLTFFLSECGECECARARPQETEKRRPRRGRKEKGDVIKIDVCVCVCVCGEEEYWTGEEDCDVHMPHM